MVEYTAQLNSIFGSLADPTRRDILSRVAHAELSVGELVGQYNISFAAISKHLKVLEQAQLITKRKQGQKHMIALNAQTLQDADQYLEQYRQIWQSRYDKLDSLLQDL